MAGHRPDDELVPAGFRLRPDPGTRTLAGGTVITGGYPTRVLRLSPAGARHVTGWWSGMPVPGNPRARALARRLLDTGIAHPVVDGLPVAGQPEVTVVIPVRDRHAELARCLAGLADAGLADAGLADAGLADAGLADAGLADAGLDGPGLARALRVIVVDDGSGDPAALRSVAERAGASVLRRPVNGGPAAARNSGLAAADSSLVAFLDSDCVPGPGWLDALLPHFADPAVGAVAPRIVPHEAGRTWLARYEGASSTLDMGWRPSIVRPGSRVPYVPGAALVVRKQAAGTGFVEDMQVGEDVDFVWRLGASGWRVRYEPAATMGHQHRVRLREWFGRRQDYGTSAATLELRHPGAVRPLYASIWTAAAWLAAALGRPGAGALVTGTGTALLARRLARVTGEGWPRPAGSAAWRMAASQAAGGTLAAARPLGSAISRTWWPVALPAAAAVRRLRWPLAALVLVPPLLDWLDRRPPLDPPRYVVARLLDDAGYSLGVWQGCGERRTVRPLLPVLRGRDPASRPLSAQDVDRPVVSRFMPSEGAGRSPADGARPVPGDHPDRIRWNTRYGSGPAPSFSPNPLAARALALGLPGGPVADLACGPSGAALLAAANGRRVTAVDVSEVALRLLGDQARRRGVDGLITLVHADLSAWSPEPCSYALVLCTGFWLAGVFAAAAGAVADGGLLAWEAFTAGARRARPGLQPEWCLAPGEPASLLPPGFGVLDQSDLPGRDQRLLLARRASAIQ